MQTLHLTNTKTFMNQLLRSDCFDHFLLQEARIVSAASYTIDGSIPHDFYTEEEREMLGLTGLRFLPFSMLRPQLFDLIKGKKTPLAFSLVLLLTPDNMARTLTQIDSPCSSDDISALSLNIRFQNGQLSATAGVSYRIFVTDHTLDREWDRLVRRFLSQHEISFEEL